MQQLIKVATNEQGQQIVSARDLHQFLDAGSNVNTWFKNQTERAMLEENTDYVRFQNSETSGQRSFDYAITLSSAKEIAMLNGGEKGKQARQYFIECEKQLLNQQPKFSIPQTYATALLEAGRLAIELERKTAKLIEAETTITEQAPMVDYYKTAMSATDTVDMEGAVKVLGLPFGRNTLLKKLREMKILMPNNHPYQQHVNIGYFKLIQTTYNKPNGSTYTYYKTVVFPKGLDAIKRLLTKSPKNNVQPLFDNSQPATA